MPPYGNGHRTLQEIDRFDDGVGWLVYPAETLARASHAVDTDEGLWVLDPLDAPGLDDLLAEFGRVEGVLVCSSWHARDAAAVASRHDVPVSVPTWMDRVSGRVDVPVEQRLRAPGEFAFRASTPLPSWQEAVLYRERDGTLYVPESLGTAETFRVADERLGVSIYRRLLPPRSVLSDLDPERVLLGHGSGVFENASGELTHALENARRRASRAFVEHLPSAIRAMWASRRH